MDWQPIETAPKDGTMVLLHEGSGYNMRDPEEADGYRSAVHVGWWGDLGFYDACGVSDWIDLHGSVHDEDADTARWSRVGLVTHWMPLPDPPSQIAT